MARRKRETTVEPERPSDDPGTVRQLAEENVRKAGEALRAMKLPNGAEPCTVFRP